MKAGLPDAAILEQTKTTNGSGGGRKIMQRFGAVSFHLHQIKELNPFIFLLSCFVNLLFMTKLEVS
jgi:hypothetical protein